MTGFPGFFSANVTLPPSFLIAAIAFFSASLRLTTLSSPTAFDATTSSPTSIARVFISRPFTDSERTASAVYYRIDSKPATLIGCWSRLVGLEGSPQRLKMACRSLRHMLCCATFAIRTSHKAPNYRYDNIRADR